MDEGMFDIKTSRDFLAKLEADFADYEKEPGSGRLALNCAMTAYHMHEWVWGDWLKKDEATRQVLGLAKDKNEFVRWIERACPWFLVMQELTNGAKHFSRDLSFKALRVSLLPSARNLPNAGAEESHWDGPMPYLTGGPDVLLIDSGPEAGDLHNRYMPAAMLLDVVVRFWREFFERYGPPQSLKGSILSAATEAKA